MGEQEVDIFFELIKSFFDDDDFIEFVACGQFESFEESQAVLWEGIENEAWVLFFDHFVEGYEVGVFSAEDIVFVG